MPYTKESALFTGADDNADSVKFQFVRQKLDTESHMTAGVNDQIIIFGPLPSTTAYHPIKQSFSSDLDRDIDMEKVKEPESPKTQAINSAQAYGCIPCVAKYRWNNQRATYFCQYNSSQDSFHRFVLDPTEEAVLDGWETEDIEISHAPFAFIGLWGTSVFDDNGNKMLFVKMDNGGGYTIRLYGKRVEQGERETTLSDKERATLEIDKGVKQSGSV